MSKRKQPDSLSVDGKVAVLEQKLFELQSFTHDLVVKNNVASTKSGSVRSTRAFADPLLMKEIEILRTRETELMEKVLELEKRGTPSGSKAKDDLIQELRLENEKLREQLGDTGRQVGNLRLGVKDKTIEALEKALAEAKGTIKSKDAKLQSIEAKVFALEVEAKKAADEAQNEEGAMESFFGGSG